MTRQGRQRSGALDAPGATLAPQALAVDVQSALQQLRALASERRRAELVRYGIVAPSALGVSVGDVRALAKRIGQHHALAVALWETGVYEARLLAAFLADPAELGAPLMDRWCRDFDNWALCDTCCFHLFDRHPQAFSRVRAWATRQAEFVRRAAFALLASLALHDTSADDAAFAACLPLIERAASDERNFVKKGVSWALRAVGARSAALHAACVELAEALAAAEGAARWVGKDALRDLSRPQVRARLSVREARRSAKKKRRPRPALDVPAAERRAVKPGAPRAARASGSASKSRKKAKKKVGNKSARARLRPH